MRVVDLYAGVGGFSAGAIAAGAQVELVVDNDHIPLKLLAANVPGVRVKLATLGPSGDDIDFLPPPAPDLHVHASSPCTELSTARTTATPDGIASGLATLQWSLDLVLERGDFSWSLENVSTIQTRALLQKYVDRDPGRVAYATLDACDFGAAQTRSRLIAAPPALIRALKEMPTARRVSVRDAFAKRELTVPSTHFKKTRLCQGRRAEHAELRGAGVHRVRVARVNVVRSRREERTGDDPYRIGSADGLPTRVAAATRLACLAKGGRERALRGDEHGDHGDIDQAKDRDATPRSQRCCQTTSRRPIN